MVCADARAPEAVAVLGEVIQLTLGALGTGCAGWERRNAGEGGLGNAAGLECCSPRCSQSLAFSRRWNGSGQWGGEVGIKQPFCLQCMMQGESFGMASDAELVASAPAKGCLQGLPKATVGPCLW